MSEDYERCDKMKQISTTTSDRSWTKADSEELRKLVEKAAEGPWKSESGGLSDLNFVNHEDDQVAYGVNDANATFISSARTAVPKLLDRVEELENIISEIGLPQALASIERLENTTEKLEAENEKLRAVAEAAKFVDRDCAEGGETPGQNCHVKLREALSALESKGEK